MPRSAREAFLTSPHKINFEKFAASDAFDTACEYALLAFVEDLPEATGDPNLQWAIHSQTMGARRVLDILRGLHLKQEAPRPARTPTLKPPQ